MAFRETERFDVASVSDSLKTFSAMVERVERFGSWSRCVDYSLLIQKLSRLTSVIWCVNYRKQIILPCLCCVLPARVSAWAESYACEPNESKFLFHLVHQALSVKQRKFLL